MKGSLIRLANQEDLYDFDHTLDNMPTAITIVAAEVSALLYPLVTEANNNSVTIDYRSHNSLRNPNIVTPAPQSLSS